MGFEKLSHGNSQSVSSAGTPLKGLWDLLKPGSHLLREHHKLMMLLLVLEGLQELVDGRLSLGDIGDFISPGS